MEDIITQSKSLPFELLLQANKSVTKDIKKEEDSNITEKITTKRYIKGEPILRNAKSPLSTNLLTKKKIKKIKDPRFLETSGEYNENKFLESYNFLKDIKQKENELLKKEIKKNKKIYEKEEISNIKQYIGNNKSDLHKFNNNYKRKKIYFELKESNKNARFISKDMIDKKLENDKLSLLKRQGKLEKYIKDKEYKKEKVVNAINKKIIKYKNNN